MARKAKAKKLTVKIGDKIKIVYNGAGHNLPIGSVHTVTNITNNTYGDIYVASPHGGSLTVYAGDFELVPQTVEEIEKNIAELKEEISVLESKVEFMKINNLEEYDEMQFKAFSVLQLLKASKSDIEKAKIIAKLIEV